jgi:5S rRNA maturation endonuclease (ribonuclease M5)
VLVTEQEISEIKNFVSSLNSMKESVVIVEGKRDAFALRKIGFSGKILEFHKFGGMIKFVDSVARYESLIILFDGDRKGKYLTGKTIQLLQRRAKVDLNFKRKLTSITKGKIRFIEQLVCYESFLI